MTCTGRRQPRVSTVEKAVSGSPDVGKRLDSDMQNPAGFLQKRCLSPVVIGGVSGNTVAPSGAEVYMSMMKRRTLRWALTLALPLALLAIPTPSHCDTLHLVATGSAAVIAGAGGEGAYVSTKPDSSEIDVFPMPGWNETDGVLEFPLFTIPSWAQIEKATIKLSLSYTPSYSYIASDDHDPPFGPDPVDIDNPDFVPGAMSVDVVNQAAIDDVSFGSFSTFGSCFISNPSSAINLMAYDYHSCLTGDVGMFVQFHAYTESTPVLISPGFNSWEIFYDSGVNEADVTAMLDVTYTPEPSALVLMLTGFLALGLLTARRRNSARSL